MAVAEHSRTRHVLPDVTVETSRREVLGAALAAPLLTHFLPRHPGLDPGSHFTSPAPQDRGIPDQVRNDEGREQRDSQSFAVTKWDRALASLRRAEAALAAAAHEPDEDLYGDILCAFNRALKRLLRAPAPDLAALALKLELAAREAAWELTGAETCIATLAREARRLSLS